MSLQFKGQAYLNFINSLRSKETKEQYLYCLVRFLNYYGCQSLENLLGLPLKEIENMLISYMTNLNARQLSSGYINQVMASLFHFFEMNDIVLNKRKIKRFSGEFCKKNKDRAYTHDEIKRLLDIADFRFRAIIFLLASTGMRIGALHSLQLKHLTKLESQYKVTVYENTKDEYFTFTTPEAAQAIDLYMDFRKRAGEKLDKDSFLIRNEFDMNDIHQVRKQSKPIQLTTIRNMLHTKLVKSGIVEKDHDTRRRNEIPMSHGFRKFWTTQTINAKLNPEIRELLLGHRIGLASSYYRPTEEEMLTEYGKAIDQLTIDPSNRLKREVKQLNEKQDEITLMKIKHEREMQQMDQKLDNIMAIIRQNPKLASVKPESLKNKLK